MPDPWDMVVKIFLKEGNSPSTEFHSDHRPRIVSKAQRSITHLLTFDCFSLPSVPRFCLFRPFASSSGLPIAVKSPNPRPRVTPTVSLLPPTLFLTAIYPGVGYFHVTLPVLLGALKYKQWKPPPRTFRVAQLGFVERYFREPENPPSRDT